MHRLVKMYPKSALKLLDKCFANKFVMGYDLIGSDDNTEYLGYDFSFLLPGEGKQKYVYHTNGSYDFRTDPKN
jgi:hypothetical protein